MKFRVTRDGEPFAFPDGSEILGRSDVYSMDVDRETEGRIILAMESIEYYKAQSVSWKGGLVPAEYVVKGAKS